MLSPPMAAGDKSRYKEAIPVLRVSSVESAVELYSKMFLAKRRRRSRVPTPGAQRRVAEVVEMKIGTHHKFLVADEFLYGGVPSPSFIRIEVDEFEHCLALAVQNGCELKSPASEDLGLPGARIATVLDLYGHRWQLSYRENALTESGFLSPKKMNLIVFDEGSPEALMNKLFNLYDGIDHVTPHLTINAIKSTHEVYKEIETANYDALFCSYETLKMHRGLFQEAGFCGFLVVIAPPTDMDPLGDNKLLIVHEPFTAWKTHGVILEILRRIKQENPPPDRFRLWRGMSPDFYNYKDVIPVLLVPSAERAISLYRNVFGGVVVRYSRLPAEGDENKFLTVFEMKIGEGKDGSKLLVADKALYGVGEEEVHKCCIRIEVPSNKEVTYLEQCLNLAWEYDFVVQSSIGPDQCLIGASIARVADPYDHYWLLSYKEDCVGVDEFRIHAIFYDEDDDHTLRQKLDEGVNWSKPRPCHLLDRLFHSDVMAFFALRERGGVDIVFCKLEAFQRTPEWIRAIVGDRGWVVGIAPREISKDDVRTFYRLGGKMILAGSFAPSDVYEILREKIRPERVLGGYDQ